MTFGLCFAGYVLQHLHFLAATFTQCLFLGSLSTPVVDNDNSEDK